MSTELERTIAEHHTTVMASLERVETKIDNHKEDIVDHEGRLRVMEKNFSRAAGMTVVIATVVSFAAYAARAWWMQ